MSILVTGGAGFIGSNFLHHLVTVTDEEIVCIDKLTYAANWRYIPDNIKFYTIDIASKSACDTIFKRHKIKTVFHFAAESHVDNSIKDCSPFIHSNIVGTVSLLDLALKHEVDKFIHISTDEVYGSLDPDEHAFTETNAFEPNSPYSASKASSDHLVRAWFHTYGLPVVTTNCSNNYGPRQHKEKFIPTIISKAMKNEKIPVYGNGMNVRDWLYVDDHCEAICDVLAKGKLGQKYNIGGNNEISNIELAKKILQLMGKPESLIEYVTDRPGHDFRYSIDNSKIVNELNWSPSTDFDAGLLRTIEYYMG